MHQKWSAFIFMPLANAFIWFYCKFMMYFLSGNWTLNKFRWLGQHRLLAGLVMLYRSNLTRQCEQNSRYHQAIFRPFPVLEELAKLKILLQQYFSVNRNILCAFWNNVCHLNKTDRFISLQTAKCRWLTCFNT